ncbi:hypothetical protein ABEF95_006432 [Exophiala dermatitidis]
MSTTTATPTGGPSQPPTQRTPPDPAAIKSRIITHMNADHALSLRLYLSRYSHVPLPATKTAQMQDITLDHIIITLGPSSPASGRYRIPLDPHMKSLLEARERLVAMHNDCLAALDLSDVVVDRWVKPDRVWQWGLSLLCLVIFSTFPFRERLHPGSGSVVYSIWSLGGTVPSLARLCYILQPYVLGGMVVVHVGEAVWFANKRLRRHWVETGSWVWWAWVADCLLEGVGCLSRFERVVGNGDKSKKGGAGGKEDGKRH